MTIQRTETERTANGNILEVCNLAVAYQTRRGDVSAVRDVSFAVRRGEVFGLVGESGCGKSTVAFSIVNHLGRNGRIASGSILFQGENLVGRPKADLRRLRGNRIAMVYQDPMSALNPSLRIRDQLNEVLIRHQGMTRPEADARCVEMLQRVQMPDPERMLTRFPHQLSGGQQQRVLIAMALLNRPALLIMDEPTTALDVTVEAAVLDLIGELRKDFDTAILYISHNLGVIARVADRVGVMYAGEIVEAAPTRDLFLCPQHPYTVGLLGCVPRLGSSKESSSLIPILGSVPAPDRLPPGCTFGPRCGQAQEVCRQARPQLLQVQPGQSVACHFPGAASLNHAALPPALAAPSRPAAQPLLTIDNAKTYYTQPRSLFGRLRREEIPSVRAVDGVSLTLPRGRTLGIVGESGCGKTTLAKTIVGLEPMTGGKMEFLGFDLSLPAGKRGLNLLKQLQMVFQNPDSTMNPSFTIGRQLARPLRCFRTVPASQIDAEIVRLLESVKLRADYRDRLPRQLSGGEKQRVGIARAFAARPDLVVCDEPVSSLDVSVQAAVLNLLLEIQAQQGTALIFIAHDLSVVRFFSDYVAVMYLGQVCEHGSAEAIYAPPYHPYTEALLSAVPIADPTVEQERIRLTGPVPSALHPPSGCRFHTRCHRSRDICATQAPAWQDAGGGHRICCHIPLGELRCVPPVISAG
jgi:peptide/nickel transport system ATP-binding protein